MQNDLYSLYMYTHTHTYIYIYICIYVLYVSEIGFLALREAVAGGWRRYVMRSFMASAFH
jgi:hypothetical protein